jgi:VWFA-related protein
MVGSPLRAPISRRGFFLSLGSVLAAARRLRGQQPPTFSSDVKVVNVFATVRDKQGSIVRHLTKDEFILEEDGRPQAIRYFSEQSDLPLTLGLLVDTSLSQRRLLDEERRASFRFLDQVLRPDKDMTFVIHFDRDCELLQDLTSSRKDLEAALEKLETPSRSQWGGSRRWPGSGQPPQGARGGPGTTLYDAVFLAADEIMKRQAGRKAVILLTDGIDTGSKVSLNSAIESSQRADTLAYSIRFYDEQAYGGGYSPTPRGPYGGRRRGGMPSRLPVQSHPDGKKILERLSRETGGGYFDVSKKQSIDQIFDRIQEELRNQYTLGYTSDKTGGAGEYRRIHVATRQKALIVQARDGYYARA